MVIKLNYLNVDKPELWYKRFFFVLDQNVHIIYVTPTDLEGDLESYYEQMLNMRASVESGTPEVIEKLQDRVTFVYPENAIKFMVCYY